MRVDAHHHFWEYSVVEYGWIDDSMSLLRRDHLPEDLAREIQAVHIDATVAVQARQTLQETDWLLELADRHAFIGGVVGWFPLADAAVEGELEARASRSPLKGVRHVVQDEPDDRFLLREDFNRGVSLLRKFGLVYDILIFERQLPATIEFVDRHPEQRFVLDHVAKPRIAAGERSPWKEGILELSKRQNVFCKLSGMVTEADWSSWTVAGLRPYVDVVLDAFGPPRLMFGSDWPVCRVACDYKRWHDAVEELVGDLTVSERARLFGGTAAEVYGLTENKA